MLQSSITAWLKKPASITEADAPREVPRDAPKSTPQDGPSAPTPSALPTPPPEQKTPVPDPVPEASPLRQAEEWTTVPFSTSKPSVFALRPLPANVELVPLTDDLVPSFKRLNSVLLPVPYPESFYKETMTEPHHRVTLVALWHPAPSQISTSEPGGKPHLVGAIRCRLLPTNLSLSNSPSSIEGSTTLYISTLGLLSPYRQHGIACHLLNRIVVKASKEYGVTSITAHVWEANEDGLEWYKKRGFEVIGKEEGYYTKLRPRGAWLVRKWIRVGDLLSAGQGS